MSALFEPLVQAHPDTMAPIAGLATHYKVERDGARYTFYLRGHPAPEGIRLAGPESLPWEFTRGSAGAAFGQAARWSDGITVTAYDVVYSWRRYVAPETGFLSAYALYPVAGAEAINSGKLPPDRLGVRAPDPFSLEVTLRAPAADFLMLCSTGSTLPMPRHAIKAARREGREALWTEPGRLPASGPFALKESRPRESTLLAKNPGYFDAALVGVEQIAFSAADGATVLNLFRAGLADSMEGRVLPLQLAPRMSQSAALHVRPACASHNWRISARRPPLDNVLLRYALNMATDKESTAHFLGAGQIPATRRVPPLSGYRSPPRLPLEINGRTCDVLEYNPRIARELWNASVPPGPQDPLPVHYFAREDSNLLAQILQQQWRRNLGLETRLLPREAASYVQSILTEGDFEGVAEDSYFANYADPYDLLSLYISPYPSWSDAEFDRMLAAATSALDPPSRMDRLSQCEARLLRGMPFVPLYFDTWVYLERPEVHGLRLNPLGLPAFKYAWIDTSQRVQ